MGPKPTFNPPGASGTSKRKAGTPANHGRSEAAMNKRAKVFAARNIPTQPAEVALRDGELDLAAFVAAHEFEIRALEQSMATTKAVSCSRAFQMVPRELRRRTASHNPKRVPKRLRARARREMEEDNAPLVESRRRRPRTLRARIRAQARKRLYLLTSRKRAKAAKGGKLATQQQQKARPNKIRRNMLNEPPRPPAKFRKRQMNKTWLPTHRWHAKRARMTDPKNPLWRFAIPLTPNEKMYRPTHRAQGERGTLVWDVSYMSTIGLYGTPAGLERVLRRIGVCHDSCWNDRGRRWREGTRAWTGFLSSEDKEVGRRRTCPATVLWNPEPPRNAEDSAEATRIARSAEASAEASGQRAKGTGRQRQAYLRVHPSAFLQVFNQLLGLTKMENSRVYIEDLRFEIGSIELTGPASTEALLAVLTPYPFSTANTTSDHNPNRHAALFQSLRGLTNPASLPANAVLSFAVQDPRLRYPPRKTDYVPDETQHMQLLTTIAEWRADDNLQPSSLFDRDARHAASRLPSQKAVNRRRSKAAPGTFLRPDAADPPIPILLLASRVSGTRSSSTQGTWTLLAPWATIQPLWYSLVHTPLSSGGNPRFAGLQETMQVALERGCPSFPADYIGTAAAAEWETERRRIRHWEYSRRPKSKRTEWASLDLGAGRKGEIGDGLANDFELLFSLPSLTLLHSLSLSAWTALLSSASQEVPPNAVVCAHISILGRGVAKPCARIYRLPSSPADDALPRNLRAQWLARIPSAQPQPRPVRVTKDTDMETRQRLLAQELVAPPPAALLSLDMAGHPLVPGVADLIGFVTTGAYCLATGGGLAMGSIAVDKVLADVRSNPKEGRLCIVRNAGEKTGWIARWEVV